MSFILKLKETLRDIIAELEVQYQFQFNTHDGAITRLRVIHLKHILALLPSTEEVPELFETVRALGGLQEDLIIEKEFSDTPDRIDGQLKHLEHAISFIHRQVE